MPHSSPPSTSRHRTRLLGYLIPSVLFVIVAALFPLSGARAATTKNLLTDASHSIESSDLGWTAQGNTSVSRSTEYAAVGSSSLRVLVAKSGWIDDSRTARVGTSTIRAKAGQSYRGFARVRPGGDPAPVRCELRWYDARGNIVGTHEGAPSVMERPGEWVQTSCDATAPKGTQHLALRVFVADADYGDVHYVDDAWLTTGGAPPEPTTTTVPEEPGTSSPAGDNLLSDDTSSVETSAGGWTAQGNTSIARSTDTAAVGAASLKVLVEKSGWVDDSRTARVGTVPVAASAGAAYTGSLRVKPGAGATAVRCELRWYDHHWNIVSTFEGAPLVREQVGEWVTASCSATAPSGASNVGLRAYFTDVDYGDVHYIDDAWLTTAAGDGQRVEDSGDDSTTTEPPQTTTSTTQPTTTTSTTTSSTTTTAAPSVPSDFPDASSTGPSGSLAPSGTITTSHAGQVIENLDIAGEVRVNHDDVTIRNVRIRSQGGHAIYNLGNRNLVVEDCELDGQGRNATSAIAEHNYTLRRCEVHGFGEGPRINGNVVLEDNYIHGFANFISQGAHQDCVQATSGWNIVIRGNTCIIGVDGANASIYFATSSGGNVLIEDNLIGGGTYAMYCGDDLYSGVTVRNNHFTTQVWPNSGWAGPMAYCSQASKSGNVWHDGPRAGQPIS